MAKKVKSMSLIFPYKPRILNFLLAGFFFAFCGAVLLYMGLSNDRGMILNRIFTFSESQASWFFYILAICSFAFVLLAVFTVVKSRLSPKTLEITDEMLICPKSGISTKVMRLPFRDISKVEEQVIQHQRFLMVHHEGGKFSIPKSMLPDKAAFEQVVLLLEERVSQVDRS